MPTYDYICENCGYEFERFQSITANPIRKCSRCGKRKLKRLIGAGAGVIFKGSGFYQTDYRSENYKNGEKSEKSSTTKEKTSAESKDTKSSQKTKSGTKNKKESA